MLGGFPQDGSAVDRAVTWAIATFVDGRAFPMFGLLFGYGVAHIVAPADRDGLADPVRCCGDAAWCWSWSASCDAMLLYVGDILAAYGVLLFLGVWAIRWKDRWLLVVAGAVLRR